MKAFNLATHKQYYAQEGDMYTRRMLSNADYYIDQGDHILLLIPLDEAVDEQIKHKYFEIDGKLYFSIPTTSHGRLVEVYKRSRTKQESLF